MVRWGLEIARVFHLYLYSALYHSSVATAAHGGNCAQKA